MCISRLLPGAAMSTGYSTSYGVCCGRQACLQHGKEPGGTGCAGHARAPVQHTLTGSCSDPAPAGLEGSLRLTFPGSPGTPGVPSQLTYPHTAPAATTHQARDSAFCPDTKYVKSLKWLNNSILIILPFMYWIFTVSAWGGWICLYYTINTDALAWNVLQSQSLQSAISDPIWDLLDTAGFPRHHMCPSHKDGDMKASFTGSIIFDVCQIISQGSKHRHVKFMFCDCIY